MFLFQILHLWRFKYNWVNMALRILTAAGLKSPENLFFEDNLGQHNVRSVYKLLKRKIIEEEEQRNKLRVLRQKRPSLIDWKRLTPGQGLMSLKEENLSENQIRGSQVQLTMLSGNIILDSVKGPVNCHAFGCSGQDNFQHFVNCEKNGNIGDLKRNIMRLLPRNPILKNECNMTSNVWTAFTADPFSTHVRRTKMMFNELVKG